MEGVLASLVGGPAGAAEHATHPGLGGLTPALRLNLGPGLRGVVRHVVRPRPYLDSIATRQGHPR